MGVFEKLERYRKITVTLSVILVFLFLAFSALLILSSYDYLPLAGVLFAVIPAIACAVGVALCLSRYTAFYKENLVRAVLEKHFKYVTYKAKEGLSKAFLEETGLIPMGNTYSSSDFLAGWYKGMPFEQADVSIQNVVMATKASTTVTFFNGRWIIFVLDREFLHPMLIKEKSFLHAQAPIGDDRIRLERVSIDNEAFHRFFRVYAENREAAMSVLSRSMCDTMLTLNREIKGDLMFAFLGNELHLAVHGAKDAFEPKLFSRLDRKEVEKAVLADMHVITAFVDALRLEDHLFRDLEEEPALKKETEGIV